MIKGKVSKDKIQGIFSLGTVYRRGALVASK